VNRFDSGRSVLVSRLDPVGHIVERTLAAVMLAGLVRAVNPGIPSGIGRGMGHTVIAEGEDDRPSARQTIGIFSDFGGLAAGAWRSEFRHTDLLTISAWIAGRFNGYIVYKAWVAARGNKTNNLILIIST
jgi:hypothetical protein